MAEELLTEEARALLARLRELVDRRGNAAIGPSPTPVPSLFTVRRDCDAGSEHKLQGPVISVILKGRKHLTVGTPGSCRDFDMTAGDLSLVALDIPIASCFPHASDKEPFLGIFAYLDRGTLLELSLKMPQPEEREPQGPVESVVAGPADADLLGCFVRLMELLDKPEQIPVRAPIILQELHYLVLAGPHGRILQDLYRLSLPRSPVVQAISLLKQDIAKPLSLEDLARRVHMSVSSLHRHFKRQTGMSPIQYRKQLRLLEARRRMLTESEQAAVAAMAVGYESITQFNREYKRMFGESPLRDIRRIKSS